MESKTLGPPKPTPVIVFPAYQLLVVEERLREQEAEGVEMPEGMERDELALRILVAERLLCLGRPEETWTTNS